MPKVKAEEKRGLYCPRCTDSKFPCLNMERQMRRERREDKARPGREKVPEHRLGRLTWVAN